MTLKELLIQLHGLARENSAFPDRDILIRGPQLGDTCTIDKTYVDIKNSSDIVVILVD
jgi:hypothetical protein